MELVAPIGPAASLQWQHTLSHQGQKGSVMNIEALVLTELRKSNGEIPLDHNLTSSDLATGEITWYDYSNPEGTIPEGGGIITVWHGGEQFTYYVDGDHPFLRTVWRTAGFYVAVLRVVPKERRKRSPLQCSRRAGSVLN